LKFPNSDGVDPPCNRGAGLLVKTWNLPWLKTKPSTWWSPIGLGTRTVFAGSNKKDGKSDGHATAGNDGSPPVIGPKKPRSKKAAEEAANAANASRLAAQLTREEAEAIFTKSGGLKPSVIRDSQRIVDGDELNAELIADLKAQGGSISDWGKYTTPTYKSPAGRVQVHFYYNPKTGQAFYGRDYKAILAGRPR
jgi:hypothetical protein